MKIKSIILPVIVAALIALGVSSNAENSNENHADETFSYSGKVVDQQTGEALAGVKISVEKAQEVVYSDLDGNFHINGLKTGKHQIKASFISYEDHIVVLNTGEDKTREMKIALKNI